MRGSFAQFQREFFLVLVLFLSEYFVTTLSSQMMYTVNTPHKALHGHSYANITNTTLLKCALHCSASCMCLSFQICGNLCQLCSSNEVLNPEDMKENKKCTNYHFLPAKAETETCASNSGGTNCCMTSQPCLNGGKCEEISTNKKRYNCICPFGYQGDRCETYKEIKSCRSYKSNGNEISGVYNIAISPHDQLLKVYCDFDKTTSTTWTLVQSYKLEMNDAFQANPLWLNSPFNNNSPSWQKYRLSYQQMDSIRKDSTKWRITCQYDKQGTVYTDYVRGSTDVNILTFDGNCKCVFFEYVNVRGQSCSNCTGCMWQAKSWSFVLDYQSQPWKCQFKPTGGASACGEDNFGYYACTNTNHRCTENQQATTQLWFGGK